jgi:membrane-anchored protein YejM (alkaline phosphatase superfamily)
VLLDVLLEEGYDVRVFASASMEYPEFRSTAWSRVAEHVHDDYPSPRRSERDEAAAADFLAWRRAAADAGEERPWFAFVLLDSAHQTYDFPAGQTPFEPYSHELDYLELASSDDPALVLRVKNRYKNALHHADRVAGGLLTGLAASGELERTLVIVTGDHGEEFAENGHWGHTSNFTSEQVHVPFLMRGPGIEPGLETRPTAHVDVPGTLLCLLGADPQAMPKWTLGQDLRAPPEQRRRVMASWNVLGLWTPSGILRIPMDRAPGFEQAAYDDDWRLVADQAAAFEREQPALDELVLECWRFLAPRERHGVLATLLDGQ